MASMSVLLERAEGRDLEKKWKEISRVAKRRYKEHDKLMAELEDHPDEYDISFSVGMNPKVKRALKRWMGANKALEKDKDNWIHKIANLEAQIEYWDISDDLMRTKIDRANRDRDDKE